MHDYYDGGMIGIGSIGRNSWQRVTHIVTAIASHRHVEVIRVFLA